MENYYLDRMKADRARFVSTKQRFKDLIGKRRCLIVGSAPQPIFPKGAPGDCVISINGSVYSVYEHLSRSPDITYINAALFRDSNVYTDKTRAVLSGKNIGDALLAWNKYDEAVELLKKYEVSANSATLISKYEKRLILTDVLGYQVLGTYSHRANVSNGIFMAAFALSCGAQDAVLIGFSFENAHAYSKNVQLSPRAHAFEDTLFLKLALSQNLRIVTTSDDLHTKVGIPWAHDVEQAYEHQN